MGTLLVVTIIYRVAPDARLGWLEVLPGSILFLILWSFIAAGFGYYVSNFGYYNLVTGLLKLARYSDALGHLEALAAENPDDIQVQRYLEFARAKLHEVAKPQP